MTAAQNVLLLLLTVCCALSTTVAIGEPTFGNIAPFIVGLSLVLDLFAGKQH